jgi:hypothetical protein
MRLAARQPLRGALPWLIGQEINAMPRYFLHIQDSGEVIRDEEGMDLPDLAAARDEAIAGARSILADGAKAGILSLSSLIEIEDERGESLMTITFADTVAIR